MKRLMDKLIMYHEIRIFYREGIRPNQIARQMAQYGLLNPEESKRSESFYLKALSLNEDNMYALANLAQIYTETARIEKAVLHARKILEINPNNAEAHYFLGYIYRYAGMNDEAIQEMEKALTLDAKNPGFRSIVITYYMAGEFEKSFEVSKIFKHSAYIVAEQGAALFRQGNNKQADVYFDQSVDLEPDGLLGDRDRCIQALHRAVDGGFFNYPFILTDTFLDSVRDDPEFQMILQKAKEKHLAFRTRFF